MYSNKQKKKKMKMKMMQKKQKNGPYLTTARFQMDREQVYAIQKTNMYLDLLLCSLISATIAFNAEIECSVIIDCTRLILSEAKDHNASCIT